MAIPADPTVTSIVTEGLKRAGRVTPSATQITDATEHQLREVKSDITARAPRHPLLLTNSVLTLVEGQSRVAWPTDANEIRSIVMTFAPTEGNFQALAQAGTNSTIT